MDKKIARDCIKELEEKVVALRKQAGEIEWLIHMLQGYAKLKPKEEKEPR